MAKKTEDTIKTVLVVDDDSGAGAFIVEALKLEEPYCPVLATDRRQALALVKSLIPDLFVLDSQLPGMDGLELAEHFQATETLKHIPILLISATLPKQDLARRHIASLEKPFGLDDLLQAVKQLVA